MLKILVIEDDLWISQMLKRGLADAGFDVDMASDGISGVKMATEQDYNLVITDVMMPGINGIQACKEIRQSNPGLPILMLTALSTTDDKITGFESGADDYLVKPFDFRELLVRIQSLIRRGTLSSNNSEILKYSDLEMNLLKRTVVRQGIEITLTPKEFDLLKYLLNNSERVVTRNELSEKVWDKHFDTGTNYIDVYINYLRNKVDKEFEEKLIHTRQGIGFILQTGAKEPGSA
jgi:two-component system, OmpR family, copper resistance phosphate regulon response regulator CusR